MSTLIESRKTPPRSSEMKKLSAQQRLFIVELMADPAFNPTRAARAAGYRNPSVAANKLMKNTTIKRYLSYQLAEREKRTKVTADNVLTQLGTAMSLDPLEVFDFDEQGNATLKPLEDIPESVRRCITKMKIKSKTDEDGNVTMEMDLDFMSKDSALSLAMKHLGMLTDKVELSGGVHMDLKTMFAEASAANNVIDGKYIEERVNEAEE